MLRVLARLVRERRGSITLLAAAGLTAMIAAGALAIDVGAVCYESRRLQGVADAAAMAAAGDITAASASAQAAVAASGWSRAMTSRVTTGTWTANPAVPVAARFVAGGSAPDAALVSVAADSPLYFGRIFGIDSVHLKRSATATRIDLAAFTLGSRLASLDGGVANQVLSGLTGSSVSLTVADYNALLGADVDLLSYVRALRTELGISAGSFEQTLATSTTLPHILNALSAALAGGGNAPAAQAVAKLAAVAPGSAMTLSRFADLGALGKQDHAVAGTAIAINAFSAVETMLELAGGSRQMDLHLAVLAPGLTSVTATLAVGDRAATSPWLALTDSGSPIVRTAQIRLYLDAALPGSAVLKLLGFGSLRLPLYVELAEAQARLASLACQNGARRASIDVQPSPGHAAVADVSTANLSDMNLTPTEQSATIVSVAGTRIGGSARVDLSAGGWQNVGFADSDIAAHTVKTVSSTGIVTGIAASLTSSLNVTVTVAGLNVPLSPLIALVRPLLTGAAALLDPAVQALLDLLGIHLGQADIRINGVRCGTTSLVA